MWIVESPDLASALAHTFVKSLRRSCAPFSHKDQAVRALLAEPLKVPGEVTDDDLRQRDHTSAGIRLGPSGDQLPRFHFGHGRLDSDRARFEVEVMTSEGRQLSPPQTAESRE